MRTPFIAGNWKMNKNPKETQAFLDAVKGKLPDASKVETVIGAPAIDLTTLVAGAEGTPLKTAITSLSVTVNVVVISTKPTKISTRRLRPSLRTIFCRLSAVVKVWLSVKPVKPKIGLLLKSKQLWQA